MGKILLEAQDIKKHFPVTKGLIFTKVTGWLRAVDGISFSIAQGETLGLVGESGCGKTTTARLILLLETLTSGSILFQGKDIQQLSGTELGGYRGSVQAVFQDPYSSLNPRIQVGSIIAEPIVLKNTLPKEAVNERVAELLDLVGLSRESAQLYPHEFSGGQRQRIAVARALAPNPSLIILDEPVSALDVSIRAQLLNFISGLQATLGIGYLLIAHDLALVYHMSTTIAVMYLGKIVEYAESEELYSHPLHPYTQALLSAALPHHPDTQREEVILRGEVPSPINPPSGCYFHPRCSYKMPMCTEVEPALKEVASHHRVACHLHLPTG
ncbi:Oligopeptide transport ATP-binding protein OppF [subsurface metagenome]